MNDQRTHTLDQPASRVRLKRMGPYLATAFLSVAIFFVVTDLWNANLAIPFSYYIGGDLFWNEATIKGLIENGSHLINLNLGAPFGLQSYDFPMSEELHFFLLRLLGLFFGGSAAAANLLYVLSFPLTALSALWVFRRFHVTAIPAVVCSLLYAFLAAHFGRGIHHLALACYFLVPMLFWVVLTIGFPDCGQPTGTLKDILKSRWFLGRLSICVAIASYGFYYSFFGMFFLAVSGLFGWVVHQHRKGLLVSMLLVGAMLLTCLTNVLPNIIFWAKEGVNQAAVVRAPIAAEVYGLKITNVMLPNPGHRVPFLAGITQFYLEQAGSNEAAIAGFGLMGAVGFLLLLAFSLFRRRDTLKDPIFEFLGTLNLTGVLLATVGGFSSIVSFLGLTQIRAYNRISVFLAFLSFMAVALVWGRLEKSIPARFRFIFVAMSLLVGVLGLWDEISAGVAPNYALSAMQWTQDERYVAKLESSVPPGAMIFQLPYVPFPETPPVNEMTDYSHFRPYLHSKHLRWSYGAIKGRKGAAWMEATSTLPVPQMVTAVASAGYAGIYIDRFGYTDHAAGLESQLAPLLGTKPLVSEDNRLVYFSLGSLAREGVGQSTSLSSLNIEHVEARWEGQFSIQEGNATENWRWCGNQGVLRLTNKSKDTTWIRLRSTVKTGWPEDATVHIRSALFADDLVTNSKGLDWEHVVAVPPGEHLVTFTSDAKKHPASGTTDARVLVFALHNFVLTSTEAPVAEVAPKPLMQRPLEISWGSGTYGEEQGKIGKWHWCSAACEISVVNPSTNPAHFRLSLGVSTGYEKPANFTIKGPGISESISPSSAIHSLADTLDLPAGKSVFKLSSDAPRVQTNDPRDLVFMVSNFSLERTSEGAK